MVGVLSMGCGAPPIMQDSGDGGMDASDMGTDGCSAESCTPPSRLAPGPYGTNPRELAGPFVLPTTNGEFNFETEFNGTDHYVFLVYTPGTFRFQNGADLSQGLFDGPLDALLERSPRNVHYFFLWQRNEQGFNDFRATAESTLAGMPEADRAHWQPRVHFVTQQSSALRGWVGDLVRARTRSAAMSKRYDAYQWAIDRTQHVREVGQLGRLTNGGLEADLTYLANEPIYYEFEAARETRLRAEQATVVSLINNQVIDTWEGARNWRDAVVYMDGELPSAQAMAQFDTLEVDLAMTCRNNRDGDCGAWDYIADLRLCEEVPPPGDAGTDGGAVDVADAGQIADVVASDATETDVAQSDASDASNRGDVVDSGPVEEQFRPRRPGCNREVARWITSYWREGRWVTDISQMLPLLQRGGRHTFRWESKQQFDPRDVPYVLTMSLRFSNRGRGMRPVEVRNLWAQGEGHPLNAMWDANHAPQRFSVPAGTRKVELYSVITGHGANQNQCAEFCNHQHHYSLNGGAPAVVQFTEAQTVDGCANRVNEGVVPNQHGTWYFGRGGWCPGSEVRPHVIDLTPQLRMGQENVLTYTARVNNNPLVAGRDYGNVDLATYLVFWR
jgi:hypothetical protein